MTILTLISLHDTFAIAQLPSDAEMPEWATRGRFFSMTRTARELSIVCTDADVPPDVTANRGWRCLRVAGTLDFALIGILASAINPLAEAGITVFALSTFDTDYLFIKESGFERAVTALRNAAHRVISDPAPEP
jgi:hypothetical protein